MKLFFFVRIETPAIKTAKPAIHYNMDETGIMEGLGRNGQKPRLVVLNDNSRMYLSN